MLKCVVVGVACGLSVCASASAQSLFMGAAVMGSTDGGGQRNSDGDSLTFTPMGVGGPSFTGSTSGQGGTSGGLGDGPALVASASTVFTGSILTTLLRNGNLHTELEFTMHAMAAWLDPVNYSGFMNTGASIEITVDIEGMGQMPYIIQPFGAFATGERVFSLEADGNGASIVGNLLTPGRYKAKLGGGAFVDSTTGPLFDETSGSVRVIVPGPGTGAVLGLWALVGARRRRGT